MTVSTKVGTFTILSSDAVNTTQQITVGFQPKLILFWSTGQASATDAVTSQTARYGFGAAASSTLRQCVGGTSTHASAAIDGGRIARVDACFATILAAGTVDGLLDISAIDSTSFTVIVDDQFASSIRISYMAFGGDAITDVVMGVFATNTTTGTQDITGLSFQPNFLMTFGSASTTAAPFASSSRDFISVGAASSASNQAIISIGEGPEANATSQASSYLYYGEVAAPLFDTPTEMRNRASFVQFLSTGFRLNWLEAAFAYQLMYVAVRGGSWSVGNLQTQTNTTTDIAKSGIGFQPAGVILFSHNMVQSTQDTVQGDGRLSIGAFTSTTERVAQALLLETGLADTDVTNAIEHDEVYANIATDGTIQGLMDVKSVDADGFTLIMDDADPAQAYAYYIAVGESSAVTISKSFAFASDAEGLADAGNHASLTFAYEAADGNPAGSVKFTTTLKAATQTEFARNASTGQTWESWGVPAGATVTNVAIGLWNEKTVGITKLSSHSLKARIISSGGTTVHSASDLLNATLAITSDSTWQTGAAGPSVAVDSGYQASTTDVRLELEYTCVTGTGGGNAAVDQRFDSFRIDITYTPASGGTQYTKSVAGSLVGSGAQIRNVATSKSATLPSAGTAIKSSSRSIAGAVSPTATILKSTSKLLSGVVATGGAILRQFGRSVLGAITSNGSLVRMAGKSVAGTVTTSASPIKTILKALSGSVSFSGAVSIVRTFIKLLAGTVAATGTVTRSMYRALQGSAATSGQVIKLLARSLGGSIAPSGTAVALKTFLRSLSGSIAASGTVVRQTWRNLAATITTSGVLSRTISFARSLSGAISTGGTVIKQTYRSLLGSIASSATVSAIRVFVRLLSGSIATSGTVAKRASTTITAAIASNGSLYKQLSRSLAGVVAASGTVSAIRVFVRYLSGALGSAGSLSKRAALALFAWVGTDGGIAKKASMALSGSVGLSGVVDSLRSILIYLAGSVGMTGSLGRATSKGLAAALLSAGAVSRSTVKSLVGSAGLAGTVTKRALFSLVGTLGSSGALGIAKTFLLFLGGSLGSAGSLIKMARLSLAGSVGLSAILAVLSAGTGAFVGKLRLSGSWVKTALSGKFNRNSESGQGGLYDPGKNLDGEL